MANEPYKISLGVDLKVNDIRDRIRAYNSNKNNAKLKLGVSLDPRGISEQIKKINLKTPVKINLNLDTRNAQAKINDIKRQIQQLGNIRVNLGGNAGSTNSGTQRVVNDMNWAYRQMLDIQKKANSLSLKMNGLDTSKNVNELKELSSQFARLKSDYETLKRVFGGQLSTVQWGNLQAEIDETNSKLAAMDAKFKDTKARIAKGIQLKLNDGTFANDISNIETKFNALSNKSSELRIGIDRVKSALYEMNNASKVGNIEALIIAQEDYKRVLRDVENQLRINARAEKEANAGAALSQQRQTLSLQMSKWLRDNSAAASQFGAKIKEMQAALVSCDNTTLQRLRSEFANIRLQADMAGKSTQTFGDKLKKQFSKYSAYFSVHSLFMYGTMAIRSMFNQVKEIDSAMTELKKVTDETAESYNRFLSNAATRSKEIGTTISGLVASTADFARLGYGFEDAQGLAEVANIYAVVGDEVEGVEGATESLISTMAAFKDQANDLSNEDFAMDIIDKFNEIGNNFAISSGGIGEALKRSASSLDAANNTLDESVALITAANTVVQDPEQVGTAFKTISMRIRGAKTELEEAGLETEGMVESTAKLREEILALTGVDIMENNDTFKSTYAIMDELSQKWKDLTDIQQASVTELIAGKRQGNIVSSLMTNFDIARQALDISMNSAGSAMAEHEKWMKSVEASINKVKASWQSLSQSFLKSNFLKGLLGTVTKLLDAFTALTDIFGTLPTLLGLFTAFKSFSGKGFFRVIKDEATGTAKGITNVFKQSAAEVTKTFQTIGLKTNSGFKNVIKSDVKALGDYRRAVQSGIPTTDAFSKCMAGASDSAKQYAKSGKILTAGWTGYVKQQKSAQISIVAQNKSLSNARGIIKEYYSGCKNAGMSQAEFAKAVNQTNPALAQQLTSAKSARSAMSGYVTSMIAGKAATIALNIAVTALNMALTMGIGALISWAVQGLDKAITTSKELAESVEEVTSKFKEQYNELRKLKGGYDTSSETSMISKYEKLSKGVDSLGRNVSLTSEEYSEYQSIVNSIAEQIPSLVSGYDEQGNALLSCKGNVEELTAAYEKLIHVQNQEILSQNSKNIEKNFKNVVSDAKGYGFWELIGNSFAAIPHYFGLNPSSSSAFDAKTNTAEIMSDLLNSNASAEEVKKALSDYNIGARGRLEVAQLLSSAGYDADVYNVSKVFAEVLEKEPHKIKGILDNYYAQFDEAIAQYKTKATALLSEAFDVSSAISGLNYGNISEELQNIAYQTVNSLDFDFLSNLSESGKTIDQWTKEMLNQLNSIGEADNAKIEAAFDLQTQFNGGEISYGEYVKNLQEVQSVIDGLNLKGEAKEQLEISLGLDENGIIDQYNALVKRLTNSKNYDFDVTETEAKKLLDGLNSEELAIAVDVITDFSNNNYAENAKEIKTAIERELAIRGLSLELDVEVETEKIEALSTAITESFSGSGLSKESVSAVESMFGSLKEYDASKLFERTANGIRLNSDEFRKLNSEYKKINIAEVNKEMDSLGDIYNQTREELYRLTYGTDEYDKKARELSDIEARIKATEKLAAQYEGLASAYQEWQMVEEAGSQRDMYESLIEGFENIDDEISRGWLDDGTIEFLELLTGRTDLATLSAKELKSVYKGLSNDIEHTSYSVRDFFTVDDDGNSTSRGVYNFLDAIGQLEEEKFNYADVVRRDDKGNIIGFNFDLVGGDEVIAEALGISEELVQIMVRAADDAGFVVTMDGTYEQLDILKTKAQEAAVVMNKALEAEGKTTIDIDMNADTIEEIQPQLDKIMETFGIKDGSGKLTGAIDIDAEGGEEALTVASTLQSMLDRLNRPTYMNIEVSQVEDEIQEPLKHLQQLQTLTEKEHQFKLAGTDTSELEKDKQEIYDYFEELDPEVKAEIGLVDKDGNPLTGDALKEKLNSGDIAIEATVDIQLKMDEKLGILVDKALLEAGIIDKEEFEKRVDIYLNADVDNEDAKEKTEQAVNEVADGKGGKSSKDGKSNGKSTDSKVEKKVNVDVKADEVDTSDVKDKTKESVENETDEKLTVETTVELETTIEEATELIQKFEDKDITIDVKVKGIDDVKELNKNIDLATKIDGDIDKLNDYVKAAETLSGLDDNISTYVTAEIKGNVTDKKKKEIESLTTLAESADNLKVLKEVGSFTTNINADVEAKVKGNVTEIKEKAIDNLSVFADEVKALKEAKIDETDITAKIKADISGNVTELKEKAIDNLSVFADEAKALKEVEIGSNNVASITANIFGNVTEKKEKAIDNIDEFITQAKALKAAEVGTDEKASVRANISGNVIDIKEKAIDNLSKFVEHAEVLKTAEIGSDNVASVTANIFGNVIEKKESAIDNLSKFADEIKNLQTDEVDGVDLSMKVKADISGNVIDRKEIAIDNLSKFADEAKELKEAEIGANNVASVTANIYGNVIDRKEIAIDNLSAFVEHAQILKNASIGTDERASVTANVYGNVVNTKNSTLDNLSTFIENATTLASTEDVVRTVTADAKGNVVSGEGAASKLASLTEFKSLISGMTSQDVTVSVTAKVDSENVNAAIDLLKKVSDSGVFKDYKATVQVGAKVATIDDTVVQNYKVPKKDGKVAYSVDPESSVFTWTAPSKDGVVNYSAEVDALTKAQKHKTGTITYTPKIKGFPVVNGTANANGSAFANGTAGKAFRQGDWGVKRTETALTGELGQELVVYGNRYWTVGDNGAEFATIPKGAIVFNHKQTEELFKNGKVTSNGGRGRAFLEGTAFKDGSTGSGGGVEPEVDSKNAGADAKFEETIDWIEVIIDRVERAIDEFDQQANNIYKSWDSRNKALDKQIAEIGKEIALQQSGYNRYMQEANSVGLDESWASKVRNGSISIDDENDFDEDTAKKIKEYQEWYNKALDCDKAIEELKETEASLYAQRFENIQTQYDGILQGYEHTEAMLNEYISQAEEQGHIVSKKYYEALIDNEKKNINILKQEQAALIAERDKAVDEGKITKGSQAWIDMCNDIDSVTQSIEEGETAILSYGKAMKEVDWEKFDLAQEKISDVTAEADFLIELMSNKDLHNDNGKLTEQGAATLGLHGLNYNTHMYQADDYGAEIAKIDRQIASGELDGNSKDVINRRRELVEAQRESILAAEDEKQAIKDLVEEGINKELDALQERIDLHNEELDSMKDLYDYQKNVEEQTKNIASLRKQLGAYEGFDDEETRAKVQELKVSLEEAEADLFETEYEKFISDQTVLLDTLYTEYETILNSRLDNIDFLLQGVIDGINAAAGESGILTSALGSEGAIATAIVNAMGENGTIKTILNTEANNVGTTLSTAMNNIWSVGEGNARSVLTTYGDGFQGKQTTTNNTLSGIKSSVDAMVDDVDKDAQKKVDANKTQSSAKADPTKDTKPTTTPNTNNKSSNSNGDGKPAVGDKVKFVSGKYYYDSQGKNPAGSKNQGKQVYITKINDASWATHPYHISTGSKLGSGDLGWLKKEQISGYAAGKKNFANNEWAWTQEKGEEYIVRPSDGAILTPITRKGSVLNAEASSNLWNMTNSPTEFIKDNLKLDTANVPNGANVQSNYTQHLDKVVFNLPNVKNYDELLSAMQKDKNFEKLILSMSIDRIAGKSSLAKGKSIR